MNELTLQSYGCTDIGQNRSLNEDYFDMNQSLFVIADGMGGHNAGDIASKMTVENILHFFNQLDKKQFNTLTDVNTVQNIISEAIFRTNMKVFKESVHHTELTGMGTTVVLALIQKPNIMHIANVGDSRAYHLRKGKLTLLTEDHSVTATMLRDGTITPAEAKNHPYRHHLTRSIGTSNEVKAYTHFVKVMPNDKILLCSDGVWNVLSNEDIIELLQQDTSPKKICEKLTEKALDLQTMDNTSSIVISISEETDGK